MFNLFRCTCKFRKVVITYISILKTFHFYPYSSEASEEEGAVKLNGQLIYSQKITYSKALCTALENKLILLRNVMASSK